MEISYRNPALLILGLVVVGLVVLSSILLRRRKKTVKGVKVANTERFRSLPIYKRKKLESIIFRIIMITGLAVSILSSLFLLSRPYTHDTNKDNVNRRDIFVCVDISSSSYSGVAELIYEIEKMTPGLDGDRIGVTLFNTSSIQFVPMTEDYNFVVQRLKELEEYFKAEEEFVVNYANKYEFAYEIPEFEKERYNELNDIMRRFDEGTTAGYEVKGTSTIGEGLAACLFNFPELHTAERTRTILFITDNKAEYISDPLVSLAEAADMCAKDKVTVYGIYPGGDSLEGAAGYKEEMKQAVEMTGGSFFENGSGLTAEYILSTIEMLEKQETETAVSTTDNDVPKNWTIVLTVAFVFVLSTVVVSIVRNGLSGYGKANKVGSIFSIVSLVGMLACVVLIFLRPMKEDPNAEVQTNNLDVCFVVDTTISMWADDYGTTTRMNGVRNDIANIMDQLPGSSFSLIRFDNGAEILQPFTQDINAVFDSVSRLSMPAYSTATGSSLNTCYSALESMVASTEGKNDRRTVVFIFSDGETTDGSELMSFEPLRKQISLGAVMGYGTKEGGRMIYPGKGYVQDPSKGADARSIIDENSLRQVADDLQIDYIHRGQGETSAILDLLRRVRLLSKKTALAEGNTIGYKETYHIFAGILAVLLMIWLGRVIYKGGVA